MSHLRNAMSLAMLVVICGCGQKPSSPQSSQPRPAPTMSIPNPGTDEKNAADAEQARLHQSFAEAVLDHCPGDQQLPPEKTIAGASTVKLRQGVQAIWDSIRFTDGNQKSITYLATINTDFGCFRVHLMPEAAPNHVRNFIALAKVGYYNGLTFEHLIQQPGDEGPDSNLEMIQGGCPLGTGEPGAGHLGYWLRPEIDEAVLHQPGTLGAFHDENPESAACRFYVMLTKAPAMDGNFTVFGQVVEGLDVVRTISRLPKTAGSSYMPEKPATIRSISIETPEVR